MEHRYVRRHKRTRTPLILAALLVAFVALIVLPAGKVNQATSAEVRRSGLLDPGVDLLVERCAVPFEGSAVVHFPAGSFDVDQLVRLTATDSDGWASGGGDLFPTTDSVVRVHVPPGTTTGDYPIAVSATGVRSGQPAELHATFTVRVRCSDR